MFLLVLPSRFLKLPNTLLTTVIGCKGLIIVRRRILLASELAPLLSPLRTLSLKKESFFGSINNFKQKDYKLQTAV